MDKPGYHYNGGKSPHDLSHRLLFTSTVGQMLPIVSENLFPDDHVRIGFNLFTRLADVKTSAFTRIREHIDVYFVPLVQLFSPFEQFIYGVGRNNSSWFTGGSTAGTSFDHIPMIGYQSVPEAVINSGVDMHGVSLRKDCGTLYELLECGNVTPFSTTEQLRVNINPFKVLAYNKIWYDWFAIGDRTRLEPSAWNIDKFADSVILPSYNPESLVSLRYRPWKLDYFTGVLPSPLESSLSVNAQSNLGGQVRDWLSSKDSVLVTDRNNISNFSSDDATNVSLAPERYTSGSSTVGKVTTSAIRSIFAVEKLLEITRRSGKNYADQTAAHFGSKVPQGIDNKSYHVGSISQDLTIQDIDATAAGSMSTGSDDNFSILGQVGGKGVTNQSNNRVLEFHAPCHGILMALYSAEPILDYPSSGINRQNLYNVREDYFTPEFDNLGMQPLFGINLHASDYQHRNDIYGWTYRYQELKEKYNRVTTGFTDGGLTDWRTVKSVVAMSNQEKDFYINPDYLNDIMLVNYDKSDVNHGTDPLRHCVDIYIHKSSVMSNFSLPSLKNNI